MVNYTHCPYCGHAVDRPNIFPLAMQRVFNFIWDHPGCSYREIEAGLYGPHLDTNVVSVHISKIKRMLLDLRIPWYIEITHGPSHGSRPTHRYTIKRFTIEDAPLKGKENVSP